MILVKVGLHSPPAQEIEGTTPEPSPLEGEIPPGERERVIFDLKSKSFCGQATVTVKRK